MAVKTSSTSFNEIITSIKHKKFSPVYILMGEEEYYIDEIVKALEENVLTEDERDFNLLTFYGADSEVSKVIASAQQYPVMSEYQLVMLKEAQSLYNSKSQLEKFSSYVARPNTKTVLVITFKGESLNATSELLKASKGSKAILFRSEKVKDYNLAGPIMDYCRSKQVKINDKAISLLCDYIGGPLSKLFGEIDKLIVSAGSSNEITCEIIENNVGISKDFNTFEFVKAISMRNYAKTLQIAEYFSNNPKQNPFLMILATLFNYFSKLIIALNSKDKSDLVLMNELELKTVYALRDYKDGLKNYNINQVLNIIHYIRETDVKSKGIGSTFNEFDLLKELIFKIFTTR